MDVIEAIKNNDEKYIYDYFDEIKFNKIDIKDLNFNTKSCYFLKLYIIVKKNFELYDNDQLYIIFEKLSKWKIMHKHFVNYLFDHFRLKSNFPIDKFCKLFVLDNDQDCYLKMYIFTLKKNKNKTKYFFFKNDKCHFNNKIIPYFFRCYINDKKKYKFKYYFLKYSKIYEKNFFLFRNRQLIYGNNLIKHYFKYSFIEISKYFLSSYLNKYYILYFILMI